MSNKVFDTIRFIQQLIVPLTIFITALSDIFGWEWGIYVVATLAAANTFLGSAIEAWRKSYNNELKAGE